MTYDETREDIEQWEAEREAWDEEQAKTTIQSILDDLVATAFCKGQDWKKGDGSATSLDKDVDAAEKAIQKQIIKLIENCDHGNMLINKYALIEEVKK